MIPFDISAFHPKAWTLLGRSFQRDKLASTYLFYGPDGIGRWGLAITLAALVNCENPDNSHLDQLPRPCGDCRNCRLIFGYNFEGLQFALPLPPHKNEDEAIELTLGYIQEKAKEPFAILQAEKTRQIPVDTARRIRKDLTGRASSDIHKVVLFYQMERMKTSSADALLKLIEEPPPKTLIILIATRPERLLPTIQSRSLKVRLQKVPDTVLAEYLSARYSIGEARAELLSRVAEGVPGKAIELVGSNEDSESSVRAESFFLFKSLFGPSSVESIVHLIDLISSRDRGRVEQMLELWQSLLADCTYLAYHTDGTEVVNKDFEKELSRLSVPFRDGQLTAKVAGHIKFALADLSLNVHIHGLLAALALKIRSEISFESRV